MGFRNPVTSASGVDTRAGASGPGVRMYQIHNTTTPDEGVVEWASGVPGTVPAFARLTAFINGLGQSIGSSLQIRGETSNGKQPGLRLAVENVKQYPAFSSMAYLDADYTVVSGALEGPEDAWQDIALPAAWRAWDTAGNKPRMRRDATGDVHLSGIAKLGPGSALAPGAAAQVCTLPAGWLTGPAVHRPVIQVNPGGTMIGVGWLFSNATGIVLLNGTSVSTSQDYGWAIGSAFPTKAPT